MPRLPESYNLGNKEEITVEKLLEIIEDMYQQITTNVNQKPNVYFRKVGDDAEDGDPEDTQVQNGDINVNTEAETVQMATRDPDSGVVTWTQIVS